MSPRTARIITLRMMVSKTNRISGGIREHETCLNLLVDGQVIHGATGANNIHLEPASWDVKELLGNTAQIEAVDQATGDWGHIDVDDIKQTDVFPLKSAWKNQ